MPFGPIQTSLVATLSAETVGGLVRRSRLIGEHSLAKLMITQDEATTLLWRSAWFAVLNALGLTQTSKIGALKEEIKSQAVTSTIALILQFA